MERFWKDRMATQRERALRAAERRIEYYEAKIMALLSAYERSLSSELRERLRTDDFPFAGGVGSVAILGGFDSMSERSRSAVLEEVALLYGDMFQDTVNDLPEGVDVGLSQQTLENYVYEKLKEFSDILGAQISRVRSQVLEGALVDGQLFLPEVKLSGNAGESIMSGLVIFSRAITASSLNDEMKVLYVGPQDSRNRPFCAARVGKIFTMEEALAWDNGQGLPAVIYCGGYGCRHFLQPVVTGV